MEDAVKKYGKEKPEKLRDTCEKRHEAYSRVLAKEYRADCRDHKSVDETKDPAVDSSGYTAAMIAVRVYSPDPELTLSEVTD